MRADARWTKPAQDHLARIDDFYAESDSGFAARVGCEAIAAGHFLAEYPRAGTAIDEIHRRWRVGRTPYLLFYRVEDGQVVILRVPHDRRSDLQF